MASTKEETQGQQHGQVPVANPEPEPEPAELEPFSPSVFLDLPPTPPGPDGDDLVLPFISRMLMEDDIHDSFFYKYPDHPALLQAQQPFADILLSAGGATTPLPDAPPDANTVEVELSQSQSQLQLTHQGGFNFNGEDAADMVNLAFLKGMEEANRFLPPTNSNNGLLNCCNCKQPTTKNNNRRPLQDDDEAAETGRRSSKLMAPEPEETGEMVDQVALNVLSSCLKDIHSLHITAARGEQQKNNTARRRKKRAQQQRAHEDHEAGDLHTLLLHCAQAVGMNDRRSATQLLAQIQKRSSPTGDANQRLAHCFAQGLEARLAGTGSQLYRSLVSRRTSVVEYLKAYQMHVDTCCFRTMAFRFSNLTIYNATKGRNKVHIIDYGIDYGLQWPSMFHHFTTREDGPPEVRITGIDLPHPGFRPSSRVEETGCRLTSCAAQFGVPFMFRSIVAKWETVCADDLEIEDDEYLVVNSIIPFGHLMDEGVTVDSSSPRDVVLNNIRKMRPDLFMFCIVNGSYSLPFFVTRFREALSYYSVIFDMMDATTTRDNELRLLVERDLYGQCALNVVAC